MCPGIEPMDPKPKPREPDNREILPMDHEGRRSGFFTIFCQAVCIWGVLMVIWKVFLS